MSRRSRGGSTSLLAPPATSLHACAVGRRKLLLPGWPLFKAPPRSTSKLRPQASPEAWEASARSGSISGRGAGWSCAELLRPGGEATLANGPGTRFSGELGPTLLAAGGRWVLREATAGVRETEPLRRGDRGRRGDRAPQRGERWRPLVELGVTCVTLGSPPGRVSNQDPISWCGWKVHRILRLPAHWDPAL